MAGCPNQREYICPHTLQVGVVEHIGGHGCGVGAAVLCGEDRQILQYRIVAAPGGLFDLVGEFVEELCSGQMDVALLGCPAASGNIVVNWSNDQNLWMSLGVGA